MKEELLSKLRIADRMIETADDTPATLRGRRHRLLMEARKEIKEALRLLEKEG